MNVAMIYVVLSVKQIHQIAEQYPKKAMETETLDLREGNVQP